jgi:hypothetical protein
MRALTVGGKWEWFRRNRRAAPIRQSGGVALIIASELIHPFSSLEGARAARAVIVCIEPFGFGHRCVEVRFEALVGLLYRCRCWLPIKLRIDRLTCRQSRQWIS